MSSAPSSRAEGAPAGTRAWRSLGARLSLWYVVVTLASFVAAAAIVALRMHTWAEGEEQRSAETALHRYRDALESGGTDALRAMFDCSPGAAAARRPPLERRIRCGALPDRLRRGDRARSGRSPRGTAPRARSRGRLARPRHRRLARQEADDNPARRLGAVAVAARARDGLGHLRVWAGVGRPRRVRDHASSAPPRRRSRADDAEDRRVGRSRPARAHAWIGGRSGPARRALQSHAHEERGARPGDDGVARQRRPRSPHSAHADSAPAPSWRSVPRTTLREPERRSPRPSNNPTASSGC